MYTRSAIFEGRILPGKEDEFYSAVQERLLPAWRQMLHATDVRLFRPLRRDDGTAEVFLVQEIDYPSLEAIDEALSSPRREKASEALKSVQHLYEGRHYHYVYKKL
ncbi:hypothetical protein B4O97_14020 [Marispirochaeta aestuarii]|uniref:ABM domain-containing protein n=1 Tax=Marispirochaeta aestuarii TaxID=1963862 RepID=A0A1Y1RVE5_9SPIO|nr:hypothetical protein [Marispirochaeta aestuarii]ORC34000.1 hypothetical protein B4O97_14020 [Marispirochaeta aestuarii]